MVDNYTFAQVTPRHFYCSKKAKGCKAKIYFNKEETEVVLIKNDHDHEPPVYKHTSSGHYVKISG